jgi:hypothetical protein
MRENEAEKVVNRPSLLSRLPQLDQTPTSSSKRPSSLPGIGRSSLPRIPARPSDVNLTPFALLTTQLSYHDGSFQSPRVPLRDQRQIARTSLPGHVSGYSSTLDTSISASSGADFVAPFASSSHGGRLLNRAQSNILGFGSSASPRASLPPAMAKPPRLSGSGSPQLQSESSDVSLNSRIRKDPSASGGERLSHVLEPRLSRLSLGGQGSLGGAAPKQQVDTEQFHQSLVNEHFWAVPGFIIDRPLMESAKGRCERTCVSLWLGTSVADQSEVVFKVFDTKLATKEDFKLYKHEVEALERLNGHPHIVKLLTTHETDEYLYICTELAKNGTLLEYVKDRKVLKHSDAARLVVQIAEALQACHKLGIVHRDVKLENTALDEHQNVKLIDFGLSDSFTPGEMLSVYCGTPQYFAPEIAGNQPYHGPPVDVWGLGICLYEMVVGSLPFSKQSDLYINIVSGSFQLPIEIQDTPLSRLIEGMLAVVPSIRLTLEQVAKHPWIVSQTASANASSPYKHTVKKATSASKIHQNPDDAW